MAGLRGSIADDRSTPFELDSGPRAHGRIWSIVLAGGEGTRLMGASVHGFQVDRPKQFCRFYGAPSLLRDTLRRVSRLVPDECVLPVVAAHHRRWWSEDLRDVDPSNIVVQPRNRGTTIAILHALIHVLRRDLDATVVVHPSDHGVESEAPLIAALRHALARAVRRPGDCVLIGAVPGDPETEYGWIVPHPGTVDGVAAVDAFVEKPASAVAHRLLKAGGLWNTFLFAVSGLGLLEMIFRAVPELAGRYLDRMSATGWRGDSLRQFYDSAPISDFSHDVLERCGPRLHVVPLEGGWTDLGTPARLEAWLERGRRQNGARWPHSRIVAESTS